MCKLDVLKFYGYIVGDLTIEHIGSQTPVQFVHLEIPTDSPQLSTRSSLGPTSSLVRNSNNTNQTTSILDNRRNRDRYVSSSSSNSNCSSHSVTNIIVDNSGNSNRNNSTASHQVTEV